MPYRDFIPDVKHDPNDPIQAGIAAIDKEIQLLQARREQLVEQLRQQQEYLFEQTGEGKPPKKAKK